MRLRSPEQLARRFHEAYERLAPSFGYETRVMTRTFDPASNNGRLMIAVCAEIMRRSQGEAPWWAVWARVVLGHVRSCFHRAPHG